MAMYVKIMSSENIPDADSRKSYRLLAGVISVIFNRAPEAPISSDIPHIYVTFEDSTTESFELYGNVYVLNESGKTIEKFGVAPVVEGEFPRAV